MRCTCCNTALKSSEIIWYPAEHRHEDMCKKCRSRVFADLLETDYDVERIGMHVADIEDFDDE
jgi:hypothetical protein